MVQTSDPEKTRSIPNRHLNLGDEDFAAKTLRDLSWRCRFEKKR
jgi:hypothetical protein